VTRRVANIARLSLLQLVLVAAAVICMLPVLWTLSSAFKSPGDIFATPPSLIPGNPTLLNFQDLFRDYEMVAWTLNSLGTTLVATALGVLTSATAGYAFAKYEFPGRDFLFRVVILALIIPFIGLVVPLYIVMSKLGLVNTYVGLMLPQIAAPFGIFLIRQFIVQSVPDEVIAAARLDGASEFRIFRTIVVPLIRPGLAALSVWLFLSIYNNFLWALMILGEETRQTLPVGLAAIYSAPLPQHGVVMAGAITAAAPALFVFYTLRKQFVRSLTRGALAN
jgi:multiple sugar transport system permease protein